MSYHSVHMGYPIYGGYRRSQLRAITVASLSRMTWRELRLPDPYLNGNTKWQELAVVAFYFKNGFIVSDSERDIGYNTKGKGSGIISRLEKVNTQELLTFGIKLMMSGLLRKDWSWILDPKRFGANKHSRPIHSGCRINFSKAIVNQAIMKYNIDKVCWKLKVDMEVITFWRDYGNVAPPNNGIAAPPVSHT